MQARTRPELQEKAWHPDFDVNGITVAVLLAALDAARAALPPLPQPPTPQPGAKPEPSAGVGYRTVGSREMRRTAQHHFFRGALAQRSSGCCPRIWKQHDDVAYLV